MAQAVSEGSSGDRRNSPRRTSGGGEVGGGYMPPSTPVPPSYPAPRPARPASTPAPPPTQHHAAPPRPTHQADARPSLMAIGGAAWAPLFFLLLLISNLEVTDHARTVLNFTLLPMGVTAPFATTVLGLLALGRIQRSQGHLYGLSLALFDALLFPLLLLDLLIFWAFWQIDHALVAQQSLSAALSALIFRQALPTVACVLGDYFLATRAWAAVQPDEMAP